MVARHAQGRPVAQIAEELGVSVRTVYKWLRRFREGDQAALHNRPSAPTEPGASHSPHWRTVAAHLRREYRLTGVEIADRLHLARSTVARWLQQAGIGRLKQLEPREPPRRYQRERPGELIHLDIKKLGRFQRAGHRVTGQRRGCRNAGAGWDFVHVAIDDATRLAYVEVLPDERRGSATAFLVRALRWFRTRGVRVERVMTDNVLRRDDLLRSGRKESFADERQRCEVQPSGSRRQWMTLSTIANTRSAGAAALTVLNTRCGSERKARTLSTRSRHAPPRLARERSFRSASPGRRTDDSLRRAG